MPTMFIPASLCLQIQVLYVQISYRVLCHFYELLIIFYSYSTEVFFVENQDYVCKQYDWLLKDLIKANRNRRSRPWVVAMGHRPMYCSNKNIDDCTGRILGYWVKYG